MSVSCRLYPLLLRTSLLLVAVFCVPRLARAKTIAFDFFKERINIDAAALIGIDGAAEEGLFVSATRHSLGAALAEVGYRRQDIMCVNDCRQAPCVGDAPAPAHVTLYVKKDGAKALRLWLWRVVEKGPGFEQPPLWWLKIQGYARSADAAPLMCHEDLASRMATSLSTGLARLRTVYSDAPHAYENHAYFWLEMRHAQSELKPSAPLLTCQSPEDDQELCVVHAETGPSFAPSKDIADSVVWHIGAAEKKLAITFDACSTFAKSAYNPKVVEVLRQHGVPATLFVGGHWAEMYASELEDLAADPLFEIGNHTYSHPHMRELDTAGQLQELLWTQQLVHDRTGTTPMFFRPPYGEADDHLITTAANAGLVTVEYDLPAGDADYHIKRARLTHWVEGHATSGSIVIMHMNRPGNKTAEVLPDIVHDLRSRGFKLCRVGDLLAGDASGCR